MTSLAVHLEALAARSELDSVRDEAVAAFDELRLGLNRGEVRAAEPTGNDWTVNAWVKRGILLGFRLGRLTACESRTPFSFLDKDTLPVRRFTLSDAVRIVPGGTTARDGAYLGAGVICMPPVFVNIGAYVDGNTMLDSHALVGSCAQVGRRVHLSAAAQIGGVLEPVNARPVIIEDDVLVGGNCGIYEGTRVGAGAVLGAGTILTRSTPVYDLVHGRVIRSEGEAGLTIPEGAVVVPGSRGVTRGRGAEWGLALYTPVIVKYRDERTAQAIELEDWLR